MKLSPACPCPPFRAARHHRRNRSSNLEIAAQSSSVVNVIVPVYEDLNATRTCLGALIDQQSHRTIRIVVVDDRSPNEELVAFVEEVARRHALLLIKNEWNLGYAGAVNEALAHCVEGDVLLLNSDTILPAGAIDRLAAAAHSDAAIGTVTPFSNNGELTSYPQPDVANPIGTPAQIFEIDRCAARANGDGVVDVPNGVGFCLYIKRCCLEAVGPLAEIYSRGYYEDVEFCLKAGQLGFRNVCATGMFVGHVGTRSFGSDKRSLVVRNFAILEARFPDYKSRYAAFVSADPLETARSSIDALAPPSGDVIILASGRGVSNMLAQMRAEAIVALNNDERVLHAIVNRAGDRVDFRGRPSGAPQSLSFSLAEPLELIDLRRYLGGLRVIRIEIFDPSALPAPLMSELFASGGRVEVACGDLEWFRGPLPTFGASCRAPETDRACDECNSDFLLAPISMEDDSVGRARLNLALARADAIFAMDRMGEAFSLRVFKDQATVRSPGVVQAVGPPAQRPSKNAALGLLAPLPSAKVDRFILRLGRLFARSGIEAPIVVLGRCVDDFGLMATGNVFVTGGVEMGEYERLVAQYKIGALALPHRTAFFGLLDRLARGRGGPESLFRLVLRRFGGDRGGFTPRSTDL